MATACDPFGLQMRILPMNAIRSLNWSGISMSFMVLVMLITLVALTRESAAERDRGFDAWLQTKGEETGPTISSNARSSSNDQSAGSNVQSFVPPTSGVTPAFRRFPPQHRRDYGYSGFAGKRF